MNFTATGYAGNKGADECGVCQGDNSTCTGCDGEINSGKIQDRCGNCLHPDDPGFNNQCTVVQSVSPHSSSDTGAEIVTVLGAGLSQKLSCNLEKSGSKYALSFVRGRNLFICYKMQIFGSK